MCLGLGLGIGFLLNGGVGLLFGLGSFLLDLCYVPRSVDLYVHCSSSSSGLGSFLLDLCYVPRSVDLYVPGPISVEL